MNPRPRCSDVAVRVARRVRILGELEQAFEIHASSKSILGGGSKTGEWDFFAAIYTLDKSDYLDEQTWIILRENGGVTYGAYRGAHDGSLDWRVAHFMFPFFSVTPLGLDLTHGGLLERLPGRRGWWIFERAGVGRQLR